MCDDGNNNCACDWDGGDCCGAGKSYNYCDKCECADTRYKPDPKDSAPGVVKRSPRKLCTAGRTRGKETVFATPATTSAAATEMVYH